MRESERFIRKTIPESDKGTRLSGNGSGIHTQIETRVYSLDRFRDGQRLPGSQFEQPLPLTPFKVTSTRGTSTIGGGTSREALRRAKKKAS